jgi:hypothetical protein
MAVPKTEWHQARSNRAKKRRSEFVEFLHKGYSVLDACHAVGWAHRNAYFAARKAYPDFAAACDVAKIDALANANVAPATNKDIRAGRNHNEAMVDSWDGTFASFREVYLGRKSPWFHVWAANEIEAVVTRAYRDAGLTVHAEIPRELYQNGLDFGGFVLLLLWPPEHGKTAFWEDFDTYALCRWPWFRITVGSEKARHGEKVLEFVRSRLEPDAPGLGRMRARFGPFAPPPGRSGQAWNRTFFDVAKKPKGLGGNRDYSMAALGMGGSVIGTRADLLQVDDPQSRKSLNRTAELVDVFTQDWLSRPGPTGFTVVLMNRVGPDDFPQALMDRGIVDKVITVPVWDPDKGWAWPERYTHQHYMKMRRNVGEEAWERNYMQRGLTARTMTFRPDQLEPCKNPLRSVVEAPQREGGGEVSIGIGIDPGYGTTAMAVAQHDPTKYRMLGIHSRRELTRTEQMFAMLEDLLVTYCVEGRCWVRTVTVETKAFQRGFVTDDRFLELVRRFGFEVIPHMTGAEKTDEDIGVPQMATSMLRQEFDFPDGDEVSRTMFGPLYEEFFKWRPGISGAKLRQDLVMAVWFDWMSWRRHRRGGLASPSDFSFGKPRVLIRR